jgi:hypothetical protein
MLEARATTMMNSGIQESIFEREAKRTANKRE